MQKPPSIEEARALHRVLLDLKRLYQFTDRDRICCFDVSVTQCWALEALRRSGPSSLNEVAAELYLEKSTTSRVVAVLERKGYVGRERHPQDGRAVLLSLTPAGLKLYERIEGEMLAQERALLAEFAPEVRRAMVRLIGRLAEAGRARVVAEGGRCCVVSGAEFAEETPKQARTQTRRTSGSGARS